MIEVGVDVAPADLMDAGHPHGRRCTAHSKQTGQQCGRAPTVGRTVCNFHGGKTPAGGLASAFKHGRYSRHLPPQLLARFEETEHDPELLSLREDVALVDARVAELLERVQTGESASTWKLIGKLWRDFQRHRAAGNATKAEELLVLLAEPLAHGIADHAAWEEVGQHLDRRQRLVESEQRRMEKMQAMLTVEQALGLLGTVLDVLRRHVTDVDVLAAIGADLEQLVALDARSPLAERSRRRRV